MKKFSFPLGRVLDWRETQAIIEESKLERLYAELRVIDANEAALIRQRDESNRALLAAPATTGADLAALDTFRRFTAAEHVRLEQRRVDCSKRIAAQIQTLALKRREVRLLERLKARRFAAWNQEFNREIDAQADEAYLAKWSARSIRLPIK
ncbi:MAG TPA: hypothetical protein VNX18_00380 [Bryobacteraceae bacterium]|nr:hypothetical protein [Bryobacteraceae bacterium]